MSIKLYTGKIGGPSQIFTNNNENLKLDGSVFKQAVVESGTWILYSYKDFNKAQPGATASNYRRLNKGDEDEDISTVNGSLYLVQDDVEGFILFEHSYYGGTRKYYRSSCSDVNPDFPAGKVGGVSSVIILSQNENFEAFSKTKFDGLRKILQAGKWHANPEEMDFPNDRLQSIRKE